MVRYTNPFSIGSYIPDTPYLWPHYICTSFSSLVVWFSSSLALFSSSSLILFSFCRWAYKVLARLFSAFLFLLVSPWLAKGWVLVCGPNSTRTWKSALFPSLKPHPILESVPKIYIVYIYSYSFFMSSIKNFCQYKSCLYYLYYHKLLLFFKNISKKKSYITRIHVIRYVKNSICILSNNICTGRSICVESGL